MEAVRSTPKAAKLEIAGRGMLLFAAFISFVLSVTSLVRRSPRPGDLRRSLGALDPRPRWPDGGEAAVSTGALFAIGVAVTVLVAIGLALPIYGAILDGRYQAEHDEASEVAELEVVRSPARPPVGRLTIQSAADPFCGKETP